MRTLSKQMNALKTLLRETLTCLKLISYENKFTNHSLVGIYHSGNGKKPNTRQPSSRLLG